MHTGTVHSGFAVLLRTSCYEFVIMILYCINMLDMKYACCRVDMCCVGWGWIWGKWRHQCPYLGLTKSRMVLGHRSQRLQWPIVITRCPASVRRPLNYLHFRLLLQNRLMDFDETWYGWSTQGPLKELLFFGQICPGADPGRGKNRSWGSPSSGNCICIGTHSQP